ncbi:MAG TPA: Bax inhibitor-1/YccA family protein [Microbacterium sp.]|uniref:Bax inhibitor-1/YccA family protein n=1 Tax=Microbacterium sp. TaxID=51671 RepID=UPI002B465634|nr:Bax inhibitor-1/YccA family protein [Microbacterium sp.]HKT57977.1 Bax inhibitor-1/YccA family protein [Microbacterium sp.]
MAANPAFNNPAFREQPAGRAQAAPQTGSAQPGQPQYGQYAPGQPVDAQQQAAVNAHFEGAYAAPEAGALQTGRMTVEDTVYKTIALFAVLLVTAVVGWVWSASTVTVSANGQTTSPSVLPWIIGALGGFILAMVVIFTSRTKVRPALIFAYAAFEGLFVGSISLFFEFLYPGIVLQASLATLAVVGVTLALFASGKVRASKRATKIWMIAMIGYLVFSLLNVVLMLTGVLPQSAMFGMWSVKVAGIPLGLIIGVLVVLMAAYSLVQDFDFIQQGVRNRAPREFGWMGGFGIMVTVVWLYLEILRIIGIARSN